MGFVQDLLQSIGAPESENNVRAVELWAASEGTPPEWNNPLATTHDGFGGNPVNQAGVRAYPSEQEGVAATVATLNNGLYGPVLDALRKDAGLAAVFAAVNQSAWCSGCQGGHYPVQLWQAVNATAAPNALAAPEPGAAIRVTDAVARKDGGVYVLGEDGGVFTYRGAPFFGSYPGLPAKDHQGERTPFVSIQLDADEAGYTIRDEGGESYHFPTPPGD